MRLTLFLLLLGHPAFSTPIFDEVFKTDSFIFGATLVGVSKIDVLPDWTMAYGKSDINTGKPMWLDTVYNFAGAGELLATTAAHLLKDMNLLPDFNNPIPSAFLPGSIAALVNPSFSTVPITLDMLMRHTSTLADNSFESYSTFTQVQDLRSFCEAYFVGGAILNGQRIAANTIWTPVRPGSPESYRYSRANIALLSCILDRVVEVNPSIVKSSTKTLAAFVQEAVLNMVGMHSTYIAAADGSAPQQLLGTGIVGARAGNTVQDITGANSPISAPPLHPSYLDGMVWGTSLDLARLVESLFLRPGPLHGIGIALIENLLPVNNPRQLQSHTGRGVMRLDGSLLCNSGAKQSYLCRDPTQNYIGNYYIGRHAMVGWLCHMEGQLCLVGHISYRENQALDKSPALFFRLLSQHEVPDDDKDKAKDNLLGLWIALGVVLVIVFVLAASFFTEYVVQPVPLTAGVVAPPPMPANYGEGPAIPSNFYIE